MLVPLETDPYDSTAPVQDFKSIALDGRKRKKFSFKRLLASVLLFALLGVATLYSLHSAENPVKDNQESTDATSTPNRIKLSLALPGQSVSKPVSGNPTPLIPPPSKNDIKPSNETPVAAIVEKQEETQNIPALAEELDTVSHRIKSGDSLSSIFSKNGLSANLLYRITHSSKLAKGLTRIKPGEEVQLTFDENKQLRKLVLVHNDIRSLQITPQDDSFEAKEIIREVETRIAHAQGTIENSLYLDAKEAGLSESLIMEIANIFGWDIDFALEIRTGDHFTVIYEEIYLDGNKLKNGNILAAEFVNRGTSYRALRYVDTDGDADYFTPDGRSMRKTFLRAPVDFRRISSRFTKERWHPVLGKKRPHRGVDYAAKTGTPVRSSGDGKIVHRGKKGGYGNTVIVQHGEKYTTLYAHLSKYNGKAKLGSKIKQGQVIGYVGSTGLATGPHLHYEFRVNGVHRNPLTVKLPPAEPIAKKYMGDFKLKTQPLVAQLDTIHRIILADAR